MNKLKLIGIAICATAALDVAVALFVVPKDVQWVLFLTAASTVAVGVWFIIRGLNEESK